MADIRVTRLGVVYPALGGPVEAVGGLDLIVDHGEPVCVIGPSGCGKSTLLLALAGLVPASSGRVAVGGQEVTRPRLRTGLILQDFGLLPWKTALANAELGLQIREVPARERRAAAMASLERLGLGEFAHAYPGELSGGMRQRLALARVLALDADLLLMDEPLSALDALTREDLQGLLLELWRSRGHTQLLVTHSIEEAVFLGRRIVVLTPRPARIAAIVENPRMGEPGYRETAEYLQSCSELRRLLAEEGAFAEAGAAL